MDTEASDKTYVVLQDGESIFDIALKEGYNYAELMDHNGLDRTDPHSYHIPGGTTLRLPYGRPKAVDKYAYDIYPEARLFHISQEGGSKKYAFGDIDTYQDIKPSKESVTPQFKEVRIAGEVTITFSPDRIYAYYLDTVAIRDGKVVYTIGYPKEYLAEGPAPEKEEDENPHTEKIEQFVAEFEEGVEARKNPYNPADSYIPLGKPRQKQIVFACDVPDFSTDHLPTKEHIFGKVWVDGTFQDPEGELRYRVVTSKNIYYFGILEDNLEAVEELLQVPEVNAKDGELYEVTPLSAKRMPIYETKLFPFIGKGIARGVTVADRAKVKIKRKII